MGMRDLPDMYAQGPKAADPKDEGIHIRQITNAHVTSVIHHFVAVVTILVNVNSLFHKGQTVK